MIRFPHEALVRSRLFAGSSGEDREGNPSMSPGIYSPGLSDAWMTTLKDNSPALSDFSVPTVTEQPQPQSQSSAAMAEASALHFANLSSCDPSRIEPWIHQDSFSFSKDRYPYPVRLEEYVSGLHGYFSTPGLSH